MKVDLEISRASGPRRRFLTNASALAAASFLGVTHAAQRDRPPEISKLRLTSAPAICFAPQYLAEELLRLEGFSEVSYVERPAGATVIDAIEADKADMTMDAAPAVVYAMDTRPALTMLAGIHAGCYELFGNDRVHSMRELKGKRVAVYALGGPDHVFLSSMLAYVGVDPHKEVEWVVEERLGDAMQLFIEGKADAFMGFAPQPQELRARGSGHVIVDTAQDRPWSQYFCCMLFANKNFVSNYPMATKRALRAYLKAADICAQEPDRAARFLADRGYEPRYDVAFEVLRSLPYNRWRDADPEDTMRFFALRLYEVGMIRSTPNKLITRGTNWQFLNELKRELRA